MLSSEKCKVQVLDIKNNVPIISKLKKFGSTTVP